MFFGWKKPPLEVGDKIWVRTFTVFNIGQVAEIGDWWIRFDHGTWVTHPGNWSEFVNQGKILDFKEFANGFYLSQLSVIDFGEWKHDLPEKPMMNHFGHDTILPSINPFELNRKVWIRTATQYHIGTVSNVGNSIVRLRKASWVSCTGDFGEFTQGNLEENSGSYEAYPMDLPVNICYSAIVDWAPFPEK